MAQSEEAASKPTGRVQSVERAFELLEALADGGGTLTLSELADQSKLSLPTVHRLIRTLSDHGYVRQREDRRYSLGSRLMRLGDGASTQLGVFARPQLAWLVAELQESANMAVREADQVLYIAQVPSPHSVRMFTEVGRRAPMHNTGVGKAILAQLDDQTVRRIVDQAGMPRATSKTIGTIDELLKHLEMIRQRGYSVDDNEQEAGVRCYAVSVPNAPSPMAISVSGPTSRVDEAFGMRAVPLLQQAAAVIGASFTDPGSAR
ncbi:IclR family transcriptional regulator [Leucobacter chromiiresistens]|uniref:Glycerol operon regulatory protein n=1 Tax=Leucobacter chromiiresistens TaxID=1079994 RepID=A0A147EC55_9MICO|nr:IclR family transcriptional regulator [Leucobacter chromiiresistens]KTR82008.1 IclR family transcriptional regulator [Leucobacter chromiiresistens]